MRKTIQFLIGFIVLFILYHAAEYMIIFKNSPLGFLSFQVIFFLVSYLLAKWQFQKGFSAWGYDFKKRFLKELLAGIAIGILLYAITFCICLFFGIEKIVVKPAFSTIAGPLSLFIFGNFFSSFSEDILTRGYIYSHFKHRLSIPLLIIITSAVYLFNHIYRLNGGNETYLYLYLLGILFITPLILTGRLWFTSGMHWAGNSFFYLTHELMKTDTNERLLSPNYILSFCIILFIGINFFLLRKYKTNLRKEKQK